MAKLSFPHRCNALGTNIRRWNKANFLPYEFKFILFIRNSSWKTCTLPKLRQLQVLILGIQPYKTPKNLVHSFGIKWVTVIQRWQPQDRSNPLKKTPTFKVFSHWEHNWKHRVLLLLNHHNKIRSFIPIPKKQMWSTESLQSQWHLYPFKGMFKVGNRGVFG